MLGRRAPNVVTSERGYEAATGRLSAQRHALLGASVNAYAYAYTERGNIGEIAEGGQVSRTKAYSYDALERLTDVDVPALPDQAEAYALDPEGNRLSSQRSSAHETDAANRLRSDDAYSYTYDLNGNLIGKTARPGAADADGAPLPDWAYAYDALDQLVAVRRDGAVVERYRYDAFGRRTRIETANDNNVDGTQPFTALGLVNDGSDRTLDLVRTADGTPAPLRRYTHGQAVDEPLQMEVFGEDGTHAHRQSIETANRINLES